MLYSCLCDICSHSFKYQLYQYVPLGIYRSIIIIYMFFSDTRWCISVYLPDNASKPVCDWYLKWSCIYIFLYVDMYMHIYILMCYTRLSAGYFCQWHLSFLTKSAINVSLHHFDSTTNALYLYWVRILGSHQVFRVLIVGLVW